MDLPNAVASLALCRITTALIFGWDHKLAGLLCGLWDGIVFYNLLRSRRWRSQPLTIYVLHGTCFVFDFVVCPWTRLTVSVLAFGLGVLLADIGPVAFRELQGSLDEIISSFTRRNRSNRTESGQHGTRVHFTYVVERDSPESSVLSSSVYTPSSSSKSGRSITFAMPIRRPYTFPGAFPGTEFSEDASSVEADSTQRLLQSSDEAGQTSGDTTPKAKPLSISSPKSDIRSLPGIIGILSPPLSNNPLNVPLPPSPRSVRTFDSRRTARSNGMALPESIITHDLTLTSPLSVTSTLPNGDNESVTTVPDSRASHPSKSSNLREAMRLRRDAESFMQKRQVYEELRATAEKNGQPFEAFRYKCLRDDVTESARRLTQRAERRFYQVYNANSEPNSLDVRGLRVSEAIKKTERKLHEMQSKGAGPLRVVVGTVSRTEGKISALKLALMQVMEKQQLPTRVDPENPSVLEITIY